jgi:hypothetical protein
MMADIKSALEIALEKVQKLEEATEEERLRWKYIPEGERLAARYLKENSNILAELSQYQGEIRKYVTEGAAAIIARYINLPRNDYIKQTNRKAMDGLKLLKNDKASVENVYSRIRHLFTHYSTQGEQQRKQAYESLKEQFEVKLQQAVQQQVGMFGGMKVDVESQPQFQQEWRKVLIQLDAQYIGLLEEYKRELLSIP